MQKWLIQLIIPLWTLTVAAVVPSKKEMENSQQWISKHFNPDSSTTPPFFFRLGDTSSTQLLKSWQFKSTTNIPDAEREVHVLTWIDPVSNLEIHCTATVWKGFPAIEWVLHFINNGMQNTPIIEQIQALNLEIGTEKQCRLTHALGDDNSAASFAPVTDVLRPFSSTSVTEPHIGANTTLPLRFGK